jgi:polar amino acid transport system substrate-binding protein
MSLCRWAARSVATWVLLCAFGTAHASDIAAVEKRGFIVVAVSPEASAFHTLAHGEADGFDGDLIGKLRLTTSMTIREKVVERGDIAAALRDGTVDIAAISTEVTPDWQEKVDVSLPVAETTLHWLARKGDDRIHALADLGHRPFGYPQGGAGYTSLLELDHFLVRAGTTVGEATAYESYDDAVRDLEAGRIDFIFAPVGELGAIERRAPDRLVLGDAVGQRRYAAWAVAKGNDSVKALLDKFLSSERSNGDLAALQEKWLGRSVADLPDHVDAKDWWAARSDRPKVLPILSHPEPD